MLKKVSVIIPVYNVEEYIAECIESVLNQTYEPIEIVLIDDGSTDNSRVICQKYAEKYGNIILIESEENRGVVYARGLGIKSATGEYIGFVDGDDWIESEMYESLVQYIDGTDLSVCAINRYMFEKGCNKVGHKIINGIYGGEKYKNILRTMLYDFEKEIIQPFTPYIWNKLFRKNLLEEVYAEVDESIVYAEDSVLLYKYMLRSKAVGITNECLYNYRYRENSVCHRINENQLYNIHKVYWALKADFEKYETDKELTRQLQKWVEMAVCKAINNYMGFEKEIHIPQYLVEDIDAFKSKKIVLYGAGGAGQDYYWQFSKKNIDIVAWVDRDYKHYQRLDYAVISPEMLKDIEFDNLIITVQTESVALEIRKCLLDMGITEEKIVWNKLLALY